MKTKLLLAFCASVLLWPCQTSKALRVDGGTIEDVVVVASGFSDSTFVTQLQDGWYSEGPNSFDVDKDGNIYILDWMGGRVQKYNKQGRWVRMFPVIAGVLGLEDPPPINDVAVDIWGNIFVTGALVPNIPVKSIFKFSPEGRFLWRIPSPAAIRTGHLGHVVYWFLLTDKSGRIYNFGDEHLGGVAIYSPEGELREVMDRCEYEYKDIGIVQKEVGDDIYFRVSKYLMRTNLDYYVKTQRIDTVAVLPDWMRLLKFAEDKAREVGWREFPFRLIGFDRDSCFYFHSAEDLSDIRYYPFCLTHRLAKFRLEKGELKEAGYVEIDFKKGTEGCSVKGLRDFHKQFVVSGDGTIYFLHGTVDTVKVSKIILDELEFER